MSCSAGRPPALSNAAVVKLVKEYFCFEAVDEHSVKEFPSYDDRNFYFRGRRTTACTAVAHAPETNVGVPINGMIPEHAFEGEYVLKLNNPLFASFDALKGINALLNHLHANGCNRCIRPIVGRSGTDIFEVTKEKVLECENSPDSSENTTEFKFLMRVVTFIPGECLDSVDKHYLTPRLLYDVGHCIGSANAILQVRAWIISV